MSPAPIIPTELSKQNPWPGLRAFGEDDRDYFFGRDREAAELFSLVQRSSVVVLYGQSGLGKTSLLQAGLFPRLKTLDFFPVRVRFDHGDDAPPLAQQITAAVADELDHLQIKGPRPAPDETLWEYFHLRDVDFWGPRNRLLTPVIVLDQFEEIFTLGHRSEKSNARVAEFQKELESLLEHRPPDAVRERLEANPDDALRYDLKKQSVKFVITLREDFLADLDPWRERMPSLLPNRFRLERMTGQQALEVVQRAGSDVVDPSVARDIVDFVSTSRLKRSSSALEQRDVDPALLSVVCDGLNYSRISRGQSRITADLLTAEREEIMKDFYERTFEGVDPGVRDWVEDRLLTSSGYRDRAALDDAKKLGLPEADFDVLVNRRLLHREERAGVIWLELTHDSLTDPASRSRAVREQRIQADAAKEREQAAAEREAQVRRQLRKSQLLVTGFGLLFVIALFAFYISFRFYRQAKSNELQAKNTAQRLETEHAAMLRAEDSEHAKDTELQSVQAKNEQTFKEQVAATGSLFDMRVPTATVINTIQITDNSFITFSAQHTSANDIGLPHALFLAQAAEALYQVGHFDEGLKYAERAMELVRGNTAAAGSHDNLPLTRAETLYARGAGLLATGALNEAKQSLDEAAKLATFSPDPKLRQEMARIFVLSHIGLGEIATDVYETNEARQHYESVIGFIKKSGSTADEYRYWHVLALKGLWLAETEDAKAQPYIAQANDLVGGLMARDSGSIRWKTLSAEINYSQGFTQLRLEQYDAAKDLFDQAHATAEDLFRRDPENREWRLNRARILRAQGLVHYDQSQLIAAEQLLKQAEESARALNAQQPLWSRAAQVRGMTLLSLGDIQADRASSKANVAEELNAVFDTYTQARKLFQQCRVSAPAVLLFVDDEALAAARQGFLRSRQASYSKTEQASQRNQEALDLFGQAFKVLEPLNTVAKDNETLIQEKADIYQRIGAVERELKDSPKAITAFRNAVQGTSAIVRMSPSADSYSRYDVAVSSLGDAYEDAHDTEKAYAQYIIGLDAINKAMAIRPNDTELMRKQAVVQSRISDVWYDRGDLEKALNELEKAFDSVWKALQYDYSASTLNSNLKFYQDRLTRIRNAVSGKPVGTGPQSSMTPAAAEAFKRRIDDLAERTKTTNLLDRNQKQANFALRPVMPGDWRILAATEMTGAAQHLLAIDKSMSLEQIRGIRKLRLDFYDDASLYEAGVMLPDGKDGIASFVQHGSDWVLLDGNKETILHINTVSPPKLDKPDLALAYLRFYVNSVDVPNLGRLKLIDHFEDLEWFTSASGDVRTGVIGKLKPLFLEATPEQDWQAIGTLQIGNTLWEAGFHLARNGDVNLQQSRQIDKDWPIFLDTFVSGIRVARTTEQMEAGRSANELSTTLSSLKANAKDADALKKLPGIYYGMKRWKDAVEAQRNWLTYIKEEPDAIPTKAASLRDAYDLLAWYQFFARDFEGALASSGEAIKLDPAYLTGDENRALALLLLGRTKEAEALMLANGGKKMDPTSNQIWEETVRGDYSALKREGITSPDYDRIASEMTTTQDQRNMAAYEAQLKQTPNDERAMRQLPYLYSKVRRWADAVDGEKRLVKFLEAKPDSDTSKPASVRDALDVLSWYQLFARDFSGALASADEARKLDPDHLFTESQRAHSLMLLGRSREAEEIYVGNIGRKMDGSADQLWEGAVLADFNSLENEGITNRELTRIRGLLRRPEYERLLGQYLQALKTNPNDETALRYLPGVYYNLQRYREASIAAKNRVTHLAGENKHDADSTKTLESAYTSLSWYQLLCGEFAGALASTDEALKLGPSEPAATMNRAHALLFLNREKEAEAVYVANIGKKMDSDQPWDEGVLDDLSSLENEGFTNSQIAHIRGLMRRAANERLLARYAQELKTNPNDENALSRVGNVYFSLERWKEAVDAQKSYVAWLQRQPKHDADWSNTLSGADVGLAWYQLFSRDFAGSLASSDEAIKLNPRDLPAQTNRAHALALLGRAKEAEAIYLGHRGEKVFANSDQKWEDAILTDFDDLARGGITNPEFAKIRAILKPAAK